MTRRELAWRGKGMARRGWYGGDGTDGGMARRGWHGGDGTVGMAWRNWHGGRSWHGGYGMGIGAGVGKGTHDEGGDEGFPSWEVAFDFLGRKGRMEGGV